MKPSNLTTPRTLADCTFTTGYQSYQPSAYDWQDYVVFWGCAAAGAALTFILVTWG
jgi:hypothetical protein